MRTRTLLAASSAVVLAVGIYACSDDTFSNPLPIYNPDSGQPIAIDSSVPGSDASPGLDASNDAHADAGPATDSGPPAINGCTEATFAAHDLSAPDASRVIHFAMDASPMQYDPQCMRIAAGESVTWEGDFIAHPLQAFNTSPPGIDNPIPTVTTQDASFTEFTFAFPEAGAAYGYQCQVHASMFGAIEVK